MTQAELKTLIGRYLELTEKMGATQTAISNLVVPTKPAYGTFQQLQQYLKQQTSYESDLSKLQRRLDGLTNARLPVVQDIAGGLPVANVWLQITVDGVDKVVGKYKQGSTWAITVSDDGGPPYPALVDQA